MARWRESEEGGVNLALIVTPFLDLAFQLLFYFVMTYHPAALEGYYKVAQVLPPEKKLGMAGPKKEEKKEDLLPVAEEPKGTDLILITITSLPPGHFGRFEGEIWQILLKKPENPEPERI